MENEKVNETEFFTILQQNNLTPDQRRRFFLAILSDENHSVLRLTQPGSLRHTTISNVITLLNHNESAPKIWASAPWVGHVAVGAAEEPWAAEVGAAREAHYSWMAYTLIKIVKEAP